MVGLVYLDYNATSPLAPEALEVMAPVLQGKFGNPSSIHSVGRVARAVIDDARNRLAAVLGARPSEIIFTGGGTESDNLAVIGLARNRAARKGIAKRLVISATEHHAVLHAAAFLEKYEGFQVIAVPVDGGGRVDLDALRDSVTPETALVSIMSANNETGTLQPVREIAAICRHSSVIFHSDMVQSFGKAPVLVSGDMGPDAVSMSAHKFHGPKGVGALWLRSGVSIDSVAYGGSHENERRPGTENVAGIAGMVRAAELAVSGMEPEQARQTALRDRLWEGIKDAFPAAIRNGNPAFQLGNTLNVSFPGLSGEGLLINFDLEGICVSSGSACMVGSIQPSHVLLAMGVAQEVAQATVRFSLGKETTHEDIEAVIARLPGIIERLTRP